MRNNLEAEIYRDIKKSYFPKSNKIYILQVYKYFLSRVPDTFLLVLDLKLGLHLFDLRNKKIKHLLFCKNDIAVIKIRNNYLGNIALSLFCSELIISILMLFLIDVFHFSVIHTLCLFISLFAILLLLANHYFFYRRIIFKTINGLTYKFSYPLSCFTLKKSNTAKEIIEKENSILLFFN